jgi:hypothetical protein
MKEALSLKQLEAIERQGIYDSLSLSKKIARCRSRRGNSAKELKRLEGSK